MTIIENKMLNECDRYAAAIADELRRIYNGMDGESDENGCEPQSLWDYFADEVLDYELTYNSQRELIGAALYVTLGGPTCYIDTRRNQVVCIWGTERAAAWLPGEIADEFNEILSATFEQ